MAAEQNTQKLFSYGTLQQESVQIVAFGRTLEGQTDMLRHHKVTLIPSEDKEFVARSGAELHRNVEYTGNDSDEVPGTVFSLTAEELARCDTYEPTDYKRVQVELNSGTNAWVYLKQSALAADKRE